METCDDLIVYRKHRYWTLLSKDYSGNRPSIWQSMVIWKKILTSFMSMLVQISFFTLLDLSMPHWVMWHKSIEFQFNWNTTNDHFWETPQTTSFYKISLHTEARQWFWYHSRMAGPRNLVETGRLWCFDISYLYID